MRNLSVKANELSTKSSSHRLELARDYLNAGQLSQAIALLEELVHHDPRLEYTARLYLGNAYLLQGKYAEAVDNYLASKNKARDTASSLIVLNNLSLAYYRQARSLEGQERAEKLFKLARRYGSKAIGVAAVVPHSSSTVRAWLNWQKISGNLAPADYQQQLDILVSLAPSSNKARLAVEISNYTPNIDQKITALENAVYTAQKIADYPTLSWAWGRLGSVLKKQGLFSLALEHTERAIKTAEQIVATDLLYRWQWQLGSIYGELDRLEL